MYIISGQFDIISLNVLLQSGIRLISILLCFDIQESNKIACMGMYIQYSADCIRTVFFDAEIVNMQFYSGKGRTMKRTVKSAETATVSSSAGISTC